MTQIPRHKILFASPPGGQRPLIIAHRGGSLEAPENTVDSIRHGVATGAEWQEVDVGLSADDECVVFHDDTLERTTQTQGALAQLPIAALTALPAGRPGWDSQVRRVLKGLGVTPPDFGDAYAHTTVPTLHDILAVPGARLMLELKTTPKPQVLVRAVVRALEQAGAQERVAWGSFDLAVLAQMQKIAPQVPRIGICENPEMLPDLLALDVSVLAVDVSLVAAARAAAAHASHGSGAEAPHVAVWTWTVYTEAVAVQLARQGADGLIADIPQALVRARAAGRLA